MAFNITVPNLAIYLSETIHKHKHTKLTYAVKDS